MNTDTQGVVARIRNAFVHPFIVAMDTAEYPPDKSLRKNADKVDGLRYLAKESR